jgi:hypothetical protein
MLVALGCGLLPLPLQAFASPAAAKLTSRRAQLCELISNADEARRVGSLYRARFPLEAAAEELTRRIWIDLAIEDTDRGALASALERRAREQFGSGETVLVRGWVMARTEARLCALYE